MTPKKWIKELVRENTLLDRSLRTIAYAQSIPEVGKAKIAHSLVIGQGRITTLYYDAAEKIQQQKTILKECSRGGINEISKAIVKFLEEGYNWAKENHSKRLSIHEFLGYLEKFKLHHAHSRGAIVYGYWGAPAVTEKLRGLIKDKVKPGQLDPTMSLLSAPKQVAGVLSELSHTSQELIIKREQLISTLGLSKESQETADILSWFTFFYELGERVSSFLYDELLHHLRYLIPDRTDFEELQWHDPESLVRYLQGSRLPPQEVANRKKWYTLEIIGNNLKVVSGQEAEKRYHAEFEEQVPQGITELHGTVASKGRAAGVVKIVITQDDQTKMKQGDILVSTMTTPRLMTAVKLCAAIVTDEGGLTAHAAIVAREFNIPCIVGTKYATRILHDGQLVEVDAEQGIVTLIKK